MNTQNRQNRPQQRPRQPARQAGGGVDRALIRKMRTVTKREDQGVRTSWAHAQVCVEPDILMAHLYANTRADVVIGTLLGRAAHGVITVEDSFLNAVTFDAQNQLIINPEHHQGILDMKRQASTSMNATKDEIVGMIVDKIDFEVLGQLSDWMTGQRAQSRWTPSSKLPLPVFICIDTSLASGRLEIRAYQRDRNGTMFLECPLVLGQNYPKSVLTAVQEDMEAQERQETGEVVADDKGDKQRHMRKCLESLVDELKTLKTTLTSGKDLQTARDVYNALCVNPLMVDITTPGALERVTGDSMALVHLLRLAELQAEIATKLNTSLI